jgi:hypothetical protein
MLGPLVKVEFSSEPLKMGLFGMSHAPVLPQIIRKKPHLRLWQNWSRRYDGCLISNYYMRMLWATSDILKKMSL